MNSHSKREVLDIFNISEENVIAWFRRQFLNYWTNFQKK